MSAGRLVTSREVDLATSQGCQKSGRIWSWRGIEDLGVGEPVPKAVLGELVGLEHAEQVAQSPAVVAEASEQEMDVSLPGLAALGAAVLLASYGRADW